jgi:hypothetical protein
MNGLSARALDTLQRGFEQAPELTDQVLTGATTEVVMLLERELKEAMPRGATGITAGSITGDVFSTPAGVLGVVGSSQPAATFVELGTKPHMPPVAALVPWVRSVLGLAEKEARNVAFLIARKIAKRGTRAQRPFARTLEANTRQIERTFEDAADRLASQLGGPAA